VNPHALRALARVELSARPDAEFREDFAHVPLDGARAEEQLGGDLRVRTALACQFGDLGFLGGEVVSAFGASFAWLPTCGRELTAGALGECAHAESGEHVVGRA
jgi:hypothetical protein